MQQVSSSRLGIRAPLCEVGELVVAAAATTGRCRPTHCKKAATPTSSAAVGSRLGSTGSNTKKGAAGTPTTRPEKLATTPEHETALHQQGSPYSSNNRTPLGQQQRRGSRGLGSVGGSSSWERSSTSQLREATDVNHNNPHDSTPSPPIGTHHQQLQHDLTKVIHKSIPLSPRPSKRRSSNVPHSQLHTSTSRRMPPRGTGDAAAGRPMAPVVHIRVRPLLPFMEETNEQRRVWLLDHKNIVVRAAPRLSSGEDAIVAATPERRQTLPPSRAAASILGVGAFPGSSTPNITAAGNGADLFPMTLNPSPTVSESSSSNQVSRRSSSARPSASSSLRPATSGNTTLNTSGNVLFGASGPPQSCSGSNTPRRTVSRLSLTMFRNASSRSPLGAAAVRHDANNTSTAAACADKQPGRPGAGRKAAEAGGGRSISSALGVGYNNDTVSTPEHSNGHGGLEQHFSFEFIHDEEASQEEVFEESVLRFADEALLARNITILCYGPTGSGKTYSMMGNQGTGGGGYAMINHGLPFTPRRGSTTALGTSVAMSVAVSPMHTTRQSTASATAARGGLVPVVAATETLPFLPVHDQCASGVSSAETLVGEAASIARATGRRGGDAEAAGAFNSAGDEEDSFTQVSDEEEEDEEWPMFDHTWYRNRRRELLSAAMPQDEAQLMITDRTTEMGILPRLVRVFLDRCGETVVLTRESTMAADAPHLPPPRMATGTEAPRSAGVYGYCTSSSTPRGGGKGKRSQPCNPVGVTTSKGVSSVGATCKLSLTLDTLTFYGIEIYVDELYDLMDPGKRPVHNVSDMGGLASLCAGLNAAREAAAAAAHVQHARHHTPPPRATGGGIPIQSLDDLRRAYRLARRNRVTSVHAKNDTSSRSHAVFILQLGFRLVEEPKADSVVPPSTRRMDSYVALVDLAGCERIKETQVADTALREAQYINKSLSALSSVVLALYQRSVHIPYRDSKLTRLLRPCLKGGRVLILVHVAPCSAMDTLHSLKFADQVRHTLVQTHYFAGDSNKRKLRDLFEDLVNPAEGKLAPAIRQLQTKYEQLCAEVRLAHLSRSLLGGEGGGFPSPLPASSVPTTMVSVNASGSRSRPREDCLEGSLVLPSEQLSMDSSSTTPTAVFESLSAVCSPTVDRLPVGAEDAATRSYAVRTMVQRYFAPLWASEEAGVEEAIHEIRWERDRRVEAAKRRMDHEIVRVKSAIDEMTTYNARLAEENTSPMPRDPYTLELSRQVKTMTEEWQDAHKLHQMLHSIVVLLRQRVGVQLEIDSAVSLEVEEMRQKGLLPPAPGTHSAHTPRRNESSSLPQDDALTPSSSPAVAQTHVRLEVVADAEMREIGCQQVLLSKELSALRLEAACFELGDGIWEGLWARTIRQELLIAMRVELALVERVLLDRSALEIVVSDTAALAEASLNSASTGGRRDGNAAAALSMREHLLDYLHCTPRPPDGVLHTPVSSASCHSGDGDSLHLFVSTHPTATSELLDSHRTPAPARHHHHPPHPTTSGGATQAESGCSPPYPPSNSGRLSRLNSSPSGGFGHMPALSGVGGAGAAVGVDPSPPGGGASARLGVGIPNPLQSLYAISASSPPGGASSPSHCGSVHIPTTAAADDTLLGQTFHTPSNCSSSTHRHVLPLPSLTTSHYANGCSLHWPHRSTAPPPHARAPSQSAPLVNCYGDEEALQRMSVKLLLEEGVQCEACCIGDDFESVMSQYLCPDDFPLKKVASAAAPPERPATAEGRRGNLLLHHPAQQNPDAVTTGTGPLPSLDADSDHDNTTAVELREVDTSASGDEGAEGEEDEDDVHPQSNPHPAIPTESGAMTTPMTTRWGRLRLVRRPRAADPSSTIHTNSHPLSRPPWTDGIGEEAPNGYTYSLEFVCSHRGVPLPPRVRDTVAAATGTPPFSRTELEELVDALPTPLDVRGSSAATGATLHAVKEHRLFSIPLDESQLWVDLHLLEAGTTRATPHRVGNRRNIVRRSEKNAQIALELHGVPLSSTNLLTVRAMQNHRQSPSSQHVLARANGLASSLTRSVSRCSASVSRSAMGVAATPSSADDGGEEGASSTTRSAAAAAASSYPAAVDIVVAKRLMDGGELLLPTSSIVTNKGVCTIVLRFPQHTMTNATRLEALEVTVAGLSAIMPPAVPYPLPESASAATTSPSAGPSPPAALPTTAANKQQHHGEGSPTKGGGGSCTHSRSCSTPQQHQHRTSSAGSRVGLKRAPSPYVVTRGGVVHHVSSYPHVPYVLLFPRNPATSTEETAHPPPDNAGRGEEGGGPRLQPWRRTEVASPPREDSPDPTQPAAFSVTNTTAAGHSHHLRSQSKHHDTQLAAHTMVRGTGLQVHLHFPGGDPPAATSSPPLTTSHSLRSPPPPHSKGLPRLMDEVVSQYVNFAATTLLQLRSVTVGPFDDDDRGAAREARVSRLLQQLQTFRRGIRAMVKQQIFAAEDIKGDMSFRSTERALQYGSPLWEVQQEAKLAVGLQITAAAAASPIRSGSFDRAASAPHAVSANSSATDPGAAAAGMSDGIATCPELPCDMPVFLGRELCSFTVPWTIWQWAYRWPAVQRRYKQLEQELWQAGGGGGAAAEGAGIFMPGGIAQTHRSSPLPALAGGSTAWSAVALGSPGRDISSSSDDDWTYSFEYGKWLDESALGCVAVAPRTVWMPDVCFAAVPSYLTHLQRSTMGEDE